MKACNPGGITEENGSKMEVVGYPEDLVNLAEEYREKLIEAVAETDDELMNKYFEGEELTTEGERGVTRVSD